MPSKIEWTGETWPVSDGCSLESPGCLNCYAMDFAHRGLHDRHKGLTQIGKRTRGMTGPVWTGEVRPFVGLLDKPLHWKKPKTIFVNSMSDLFHEKLPFEHIAAVFGVMAASGQHTYQCLTKRPHVAAKFFAWLDEQAQKMLDSILALRGRGPFAEMVGYTINPPLFAPPGGRQWTLDEFRVVACIGYAETALTARDQAAATTELEKFRETTIFDQDPETIVLPAWPLKNVHLGVSAENQKFYDERISLLRQLPAALRWVSIEPQLGPIELGRFPGAQPALPGTGVTERDVDWIVVGGESGSHARPFNVDWARSLVRQARSSGTPIFVKQMGSRPFDVQRVIWRTSGHIVPREHRLTIPTATGKGMEYVAATVWDNGTWHTWDKNGVGGENASEATVEEAKRAAEAAVFRQGWYKTPLVDRKGGDPEEWTADLRVREFPAETETR